MIVKSAGPISLLYASNYITDLGKPSKITNLYSGFVTYYFIH